jgi:signal transduction histidine kinase/FixJ family two-component response regulator
VSGATLEFGHERVEALLARLERMAGGDGETELPLSPAHDELDAIAHCVNVIADELRWMHARMAEAERRRASELLEAKERAERANEAKSVFLRTASHEIRTPIAAILAIAEQLARGDLSPEQGALVSPLRDNGRALLSLVGNVLDLSRLDADRMSLTTERVSPLELTREVVRSVEADARRKSVIVCVESTVAPSLTIETDGARLRQILVNLVANAVKFTPRGEILIELGIETIDGERGITIDVTDPGIGIDAGQRQHLFEPFGQANASIEHVYGGTGLGLALSARLAERLRGRLELRWTEPGRGSRFRLTLDASTAEETSSAARAPRPTDQPTSDSDALEGVRVLVADDHFDLRRAIGHSLRAYGAAIAYARDGREAVEKGKSGQVDVVVMDLLMPVLNGLEATRALRAAGCTVPVIGISADAAPEMRAASVDAGCNALLSKPFDPSELVESIRFVRRRFAEGSEHVVPSEARHRVVNAVRDAPGGP